MKSKPTSGHSKVVPFPTLASVREHFPTLERRVAGRRLVYLDTAATSLRAKQVVDAEAHFLLHHSANPHSDTHLLAREAILAVEGGRSAVAHFLGLSDPRQVVLTRNATAALNLLARGLEPSLSPGDEVILSRLEHHSNLLPWLMLAQRTGVVIRYLPLNEDGCMDVEALPHLLTSRTRIVSLAHVSNVLGSIAPIERAARMAHIAGAYVIVDAAQSIGRMPLLFADLEADAMVFSAHKIYGPMGLGFLVGRHEFLERLSPLEGGGDMVDSVSYDSFSLAPLPSRLEAGTGNAAAIAAFPEAIELLEQLGLEEVRRHELSLTQYLLDRLEDLGGLRVLGPKDPAQRSGIVSFVDDRVHHHDLAVFLDQQGIAVRAGYHCAEPLHRLMGITGSVRASFGIYNTHADVDTLVSGIELARSYLT